MKIRPYIFAIAVLACSLAGCQNWMECTCTSAATHDTIFDMGHISATDANKKCSDFRVQNKEDTCWYFEDGKK